MQWRGVMLSRFTLQAPRSCATRRLLLLLSLAGALQGCARPEAERRCPALEAGELALTELRGPPGADAPGQPWLELYNAGQRALDLEGLHLRFVRLDGGAEKAALVRRSVPAPPAAYVVLSLEEDEARPAFAAYGLGAELTGAWFPSAAVQVESCEDLVDQVLHPRLPEAGSYALGVPAAAGDLTALNDQPGAWCVDGRGAPAQAGTPGRENPPCR